MNLQVGTNTIHLCGLSPGESYRVISVKAFPDQKAVFELTMASDPLELEARAQSRADRPHMRQFTAPSECVDLLLAASSGTAAAEIPIYLSVHCVSCPQDDAWINKFNDQAEGILANLQTTGGVSATSLVTTTLIGGNCFDVTNVTATGPAAGRGTFTSGATNIGINNGVVLCTGNVNVLPGPNNNTAANGNTGGFNVNSADDADLSTLTGGNQWDVNKIEFDFTPTSSTVQFDFVFGSEEYCEWVGSNFNDVFGFFISGSCMTGTQNLALIPNTSTAVAINNVNHQTNTAFYVNNNTFNPCQAQGAAAPTECQLDGWTSVFTATANVDPCCTYHIKLAIADISDGALASAVFLKANSFDAGGVVKAVPVYPAGQNFAVEGCAGGFIRFVRGGGDINVPITVGYTIGGTATPGDDYAPLPTTIVIPAGQTEILVPVSVFSDLILEGQETITILLSNPCNCSLQEMTFTIEDKPPLEIEMEDIVQCGSSGATLGPNVLSQGLPPLQYSWSTSATSPTINVNTPGTNVYTVTVTDACGTTATASASVSIEPAPTANLTGTGIFCAGATGSVNLTLTLTGVGPWDVEINNNGSTETQTFTSSPATFTVTDPGNYSLVSVSSPSGCTGTVTGNVTINEITVNLSTTPTDPPCAGGNGSIQASASGGNAPFSFAWNTSASGPNLSGVGPGTYTVTVTNGQGCTAEETVTLAEPPPLTASVVSSTNIDCNNPMGNADLDVGGGTPGYTFNWTGGSNQEDPNFTNGGTYTVTVTDSKNCTVTATLTITANTTLPTAVVAPPGQITCTTTEINLDGTGSSTGPQFSYEWSGPGITCCETTLQPQANAGGTYSLTVTNNDNGCTKVVSVTVIENNTPPNVNINTPQNIGCTTPTISLNGNGTSTGPGIVYTWSTPDGNFVCCTNTLQPQINQAGTYTLSVVNNGNGCTAEETVTVTGNTDPPIATIVPPPTVDCNNPEFEIDASGSSQGGNFTYNWSASGGGVITGGGNTLNPTISQGGTYTLTITNADNNCTATASVTVAASLTPPVAAAVASGTITCQNPNLTINGNGSSTGPNFTYEWTTGNGSIVSGETTLNPVVNSGGSYTLVVTNQTNGCTSSVTVNVNDNQDQPNVSAGPPLALNCLNTSLQLQGSGSSGPPGFTVQWTASPGFIVSGGNSYTPVINEAGTYTIVVTNTANGCTAEDVVSVSSNFDVPTALINPPLTVDCYNPVIDLDGSGSSQGGNISYNWTTTNGVITGGANTTNPTISQGGTYTLVVTDTDSGCTATTSVTVTQNTTPPVAVAAGSGTLTCQNPEITLNGNGSSQGGNFTYEWTTGNGNILSGENTLNPVVDQAGSYTLVVTNVANGCTNSATVNVNTNQGFPVANAGAPVLLNCLNASLALQGSGSSGPGFTIQWTANPGFIVSGANTFTPTVNQAGTYILTVTNTANGCTSEDVVTVDANFDQP
ncbi:MAG: choice-of-anchor L domain-containing protein, partial [Saprospiraceae bacterium]|nr:choice-of-anchor L domain-containing protein [Saprospiraceae bacterium]